MRRGGKLAGLMCLLALLAISLSAGSSAERSSGRQTKQAPQPGPEMQRLGFLLGTWDTLSKYEKTPTSGGSGKQAGWYRAQLGPGGFSIIADFEEDGPEGREIGHELISWDPKKNAYTTVTVGNAFPGAVIGTAKWEGEDLVLENSVGAVHLRAAYLHPEGDVLHIEESMSMGDAPYQIVYKATATKK
jgi:hypothetical protein